MSIIEKQAKNAKTKHFTITATWNHTMYVLEKLGAVVGAESGVPSATSDGVDPKIMDHVNAGF